MAWRVCWNVQISGTFALLAPLLEQGRQTREWLNKKPGRYHLTGPIRRKSSPLSGEGVSPMLAHTDELKLQIAVGLWDLQSYDGNETEGLGEEPEVDGLAEEGGSDVEKDVFLRLPTWLGNRPASFRGGETSVCIATCFLITTFSLSLSLLPSSSCVFYHPLPPSLSPPHGCWKCSCRPLYLCYSSLLLWWVLISRFSGTSPVILSYQQCVRHLAFLGSLVF